MLNDSNPRTLLTMNASCPPREQATCREQNSLFARLFSYPACPRAALFVRTSDRERSSVRAARFLERGLMGPHYGAPRLNLRRRGAGTRRDARCVAGTRAPDPHDART